MSIWLLNQDFKSEGSLEVLNEWEKKFTNIAKFFYVFYIIALYIVSKHSRLLYNLHTHTHTHTHTHINVKERWQNFDTPYTPRITFSLTTEVVPKALLQKISFSRS